MRMTKGELIKALEDYTDAAPIVIEDPDTGWDILVAKVEVGSNYPRLVTVGYIEDMSLNGQRQYEERMFHSRVG